MATDSPPTQSEMRERRVETFSHAEIFNIKNRKTKSATQGSVRMPDEGSRWLSAPETGLRNHNTHYFDFFRMAPTPSSTESPAWGSLLGGILEWESEAQCLDNLDSGALDEPMLKVMFCLVHLHQDRYLKFRGNSNIKLGRYEFQKTKKSRDSVGSTGANTASSSFFWQSFKHSLWSF